MYRLQQQAQQHSEEENPEVAKYIMCIIIEYIYCVIIHLMTLICRNLLNSKAILHVEPQRNGCLYARETVMLNLLQSHKMMSIGL